MGFSDGNGVGAGCSFPWGPIPVDYRQKEDKRIREYTLRLHQRLDQDGAPFAYGAGLSELEWHTVSSTHLHGV